MPGGGYHQFLIWEVSFPFPIKIVRPIQALSACVTFCSHLEASGDYNQQAFSIMQRCYQDSLVQDHEGTFDVKQTKQTNKVNKTPLVYSLNGVCVCVCVCAYNYLGCTCTLENRRLGCSLVPRLVRKELGQRQLGQSCRRLEGSIMRVPTCTKIKKARCCLKNMNTITSEQILFGSDGWSAK